MNTTRLDKLSFFYLHMKFHAKAWKGSEGNRNVFWNSWWFKEGNYFYFVVNTLVRPNLSARSAKGRCRAPVLQSRKSNLQSSEKLLGFLKFTCVSSITAFCLFMNQFYSYLCIRMPPENGQAAQELWRLSPALVDHLIRSGSQATRAGLQYHNIMLGACHSSVYAVSGAGHRWQYTRSMATGSVGGCRGKRRILCIALLSALPCRERGRTRGSVRDSGWLSAPYWADGLQWWASASLAHGPGIASAAGAGDSTYTLHFKYIPLLNIIHSIIYTYEQDQVCRP